MKSNDVEKTENSYVASRFLCYFALYLFFQRKLKRIVTKKIYLSEDIPSIEELHTSERCLSISCL